MSTQITVDTESGGTTAQGFATPKEDKAPQRMRVPPNRVIPIVFIPGIMGSNLRVTSRRQREENISNNAVWRPDKVGEVGSLVWKSNATRQRRLDAEATEVDTYDPNTNPTGDASETSDDRNDKVKDIGVELPYEYGSPVLSRHLIRAGVCSGYSIEQKARQRGWGEVFFKSYRRVLEVSEQVLNGANRMDSLRWIIGVNPAEWQLDRSYALSALTEQEAKDALDGCYFPVHAMGYNWLKSNANSAVELAARIDRLIEHYKEGRFKCEKVILVTHSMGGLVGRALAHPKIGNMAEKILGVVHGVMPAMGAPATYKRMRCGFEEHLKGVDPGPKVIGDEGSEVTAVLGNSPGGLQLLPSKAYGSGWLHLEHGDTLLRALPINGDPYEEIYKVRNSWYGLIREEWLNPSRGPSASFERTCAFIDQAREFHETLGDYYHPNTYAHYGADSARGSWEGVTWRISRDFSGSRWKELQIIGDDEQGKLRVRPRDARSGSHHAVVLGPALGAGDQTVPARSADHQFTSRRLRAVFRQTGYEHQESYKDSRALSSTLYCIVRIAGEMRWSDGK